MNNAYEPSGAPYGGYPPGVPLYNPYRRNLRRNANQICFGMLLMLVMNFLGAKMMNFLYSLIPTRVFTENYQLFAQIWSIAIYTISFVTVILVLILVIRIPPAVAFPMRLPRASLAIPAVLFCLGMSLIGTYLSGMLGNFMDALIGVEPTMPSFPIPREVVPRALYFISVAVLPAFLEEFLFRGVVLQSLRRFGDGFALVTSAILFALCHGNLVQGPNAFLTGMALGYFALRSGSLVIPITAHFMNNASAVLLEWVFYSGTPTQTAVASILFYLVFCAGGVLGFLLLISTQRGMFRLMPSNYPMAESQKYGAFFTTSLCILYLLVIARITYRYLIFH